MKKLISILFLLFTLTRPIFAFVPTIDVLKRTEEFNAMNEALYQIKATVENLKQANDTIKQQADLQQLIKAQQDVAKLCANVCDAHDQQQLHEYLLGLNQGIASQFDKAATALSGAENTIKDLQDILHFVQNLPATIQANTKQVSLALRQAVLTTQQQIQGSLSQIQILLLQLSQKKIAEQQLEKSSTAATYAGFYQSGL